MAGFAAGRSRVLWGLLLAALASFGCAEKRVDAAIDVAFVNFVPDVLASLDYELEVRGPTAVPMQRGRLMDLGRTPAEWARGARVADLQGLRPGDYEIAFRVRNDELALDAAPAELRLRQTSSVTLVLGGFLEVRDDLHADFEAGELVRSQGGLRVAAGGWVEPSVGTDFDGDGRPDCFLGGRVEGSVLRLQNAEGACRGQAIRIPHPAQGAAAGDIDGDGRLDLVIARRQRDVESAIVVLADPAGRGPDAAVELRDPAIGQPDAVALADLDRDGHLDLIVGQYTFGDDASDGDTQVWFGDGTPTFGGARAALPGFEGTRELCVGDFDQDGWLDLVVPSFSRPGGTPTRIYPGPWVPGATPSASIDLLTRSVRGCSVADVDEDGHLDLFLAVQLRDDDPQATETDSVLFFGAEGGIDADSAQLAIPTRSAGRPTVYRQPAGALGPFGLVVPSTIGMIGGADWSSESDLITLRGREHLGRRALVVDSAYDSQVLDFDGDGRPDILFSSFRSFDTLLISMGGLPTVDVGPVHEEVSGTTGLLGADVGNPWDRTSRYRFRSRRMELEVRPRNPARLAVVADVEPAGAASLTFRVEVGDAGGALEPIDTPLPPLTESTSDAEPAVWTLPDAVGRTSFRYEAIFDVPDNAGRVRLHRVQLLYLP